MYYFNHFNPLFIDYLVFIDPCVGEDPGEVNSLGLGNLPDLRSLRNLWYSRREEGGVGRFIYPRNIIDFLNILFCDLPLYTDINTMSKIIKSFANKDVINIFKEILPKCNYNNTTLKEIFYVVKNNKLMNYYFLDKCIFIVSDLEDLINNLKDYSPNQGINRIRGQSNSLMNTISIIDNNFRDSLQNHHYYH
jgi:hypothetical protein